MKELRFEDGGRTFTCVAESCRATPDTVWWWINVSGDGQRYAAFHRKSTDTAASVKPRVVAYYEKLLADRARPPEPRVHWAQRRQQQQQQQNGAEKPKS